MSLDRITLGIYASRKCPPKSIQCLLLLGMSLLLCLLFRLLVSFLLLATTPDCTRRRSDCGPRPRVTSDRANGCSTSRSTRCALRAPSLLLVGFLRGRSRSSWINPSLLLSGRVTSTFIRSLLLGSLFFLGINEESYLRSRGTR